MSTPKKMTTRKVGQAARLLRKLGDWSNANLVEGSEREHEFHKYMAGMVLILEECEKETEPNALGIGVADIIADPRL